MKFPFGCELFRMCVLLTSIFPAAILDTLTPENVDQWEYTDINLACTCDNCSKQPEFLKYVQWYVNSKEVIVSYVNQQCESSNFIPPAFIYKCSDSVHYLTIKNISRIRSGEKWSCKHGVSSVLSNNITIKVKVHVASVTILPYNSTLTIVENMTKDFQCKTSECRPQPTFRWIFASSSNNSSAILRTSLPSSTDSEISTFLDRFSFFGNKSMNVGKLYCGAQNKNGEEFIWSGPIILNVLYPPRGPPRVQNLNTSIFVIETRLYNMTCLIDESNPATVLSWNCADSESLVQDLTSDRAVLSWRANRTIKSTCTCNANYQNSSRGSLQITINTLYPASIARMFLNDTIQALQSTVIKVIENSTLSIKYDTDGNPPPAVLWYPLNMTSSVLTLSNIQRTPSNTVYVFGASNLMIDSFGHSIPSADNRTIIIDVLYPPTVRYEELLTKQEGENINEPCLETNGTVTNLTVCWQSADGKTKCDIYLRIQNVSRNATGFYTCMANYTLYPTYGEAKSVSLVKQFFLHVQEKPVVKSETLQGTAGSFTGAVVGGTLAGTLFGALATALVMHFARRRHLCDQKDSTGKRKEHENISMGVGESHRSTFEISNVYEGLASQDSQNHKYQDLDMLESVSNRQDSKKKTYENLQMAK